MNADLCRLRDQLLTLSTAQRIFLARELWDSLGQEQAESECLLLDEAERRHGEMTRGDVPVKTHQEVMTSLKQRYL